jgi:hypothetical protein
MLFSPFHLSAPGSAIRSRDLSSRPCPLRGRYNAAPRGAATTTIDHTGRSARPLPYDHSPSAPRARRTPSDGATGSADCFTSISRSHDVCSVSGTHRGADMVPVSLLGRNVDHLLARNVRASSVAVPLWWSGLRSRPHLRKPRQARGGSAEKVRPPGRCSQHEQHRVPTRSMPL